MSNFLDTTNLDSIAEKAYKENPDATLWDIIVSILSYKGNVAPYIIWMLSDFPVIELVARGMNVGYIQEFLQMERKDILGTCKTWGLTPQKETLDFDPIQVYTVDMGEAGLRAKLDPIVVPMPTEEVLKSVIINVEKYLALKDLLDKWEGEKSD
jgi:hypothetical protein